MSHKHIDRRAAIISLGTVLACGAFSYAFWPKTDTTPLPKSRTTPGYVAPGWVSQMPPRTRAFFLAWDKAFWKVECQSPVPALPTTSTQPFNAMATLVLTAMNMQVGNAFKRKLAGLLGYSNRAAYVPFMIPGLDPSHSDARTRGVIAGFLRTIQHKSGSAAFSTASIQNALLGFYNNENDPTAHRNLDRLLTALGINH